MNMTLSQKIARVFEIVGYLWLLPSIFMLFYALLVTLYSIAFLANGSVAGFVGLLIGVISFALFGFGAFLLRKYYQHSRGRLDEEKILPLWFGTLIFNLLFLLPTIYFYFSTSVESYPYNDYQLMNFNQIMFLLPLFWWTAAIFLSGIAIASEINQKYR
jgi:hypothetical protein